MNTRDFEYFLGLTATRNFSQTAEDFAVSQPTITAAIKRLEDYFQAQLVIRDRRHHDVSVTPAGEQLASHATILLHQLSLAKQDIAWDQKSKIRLGLPPIIGSYLFPKIATALSAAGLMPQLETFEGGSAALLNQIKDGHLDFALLGGSGPLVEPDFHIIPIDTAPFVIITAESDPLVQQTHVSLASLKNRQFITLSDDFVHARAFSWFQQRHSFRPNIIYRTTDVQLLKRLVAQNIGIGFLTKLAIYAEDHLGTLKIDDPNQPDFTISFVYRQDRVLTSNMTRFVQILSAVKLD
ncbi:LysR family transcriptional regulator [Lacticaseibacillus chiayiensis]|uniref:LysR family transcriptional regulator n=2 Tax=Lacticaseibacillus chiayiensis TaxID=2100821 RepID=UPI003C73A50F